MENSTPTSSPTHGRQNVVLQQPGNDGLQAEMAAELKRDDANLACPTR
jgi:hypothetical protein